MDKRKRLEDEVFTFSPRISSASRKIVSRLREINKASSSADRDNTLKFKSISDGNSSNISADLKGEQTFLKIKQEIKNRLLKPVNNVEIVNSKKIESPQIICSTTLHLQTQKGKGRIKLPSMSLAVASVGENQGKLKLQKSVAIRPDAKCSSLPNSVSEATKSQVTSTVKAHFENVFTFHPKVSSASVRIAETLGTDFMSRQQQHIENQKRYIEQAAMQHKNALGRLSPMSKGKKSKKEGEDTVELASSTGLEAETGQGEGRVSGSESIEFRDQVSSPTKARSNVSPNLQRLLDGPYANGNADLILKKNPKRLQAHPKRKHSSGTGSDSDDKENADIFVSSRSKTMPHLGRPKLSRKLTTLNLNGDRLRIAKELAEKAIKLKKIFTVQGSYGTVRHSLRARGWIEKFYQIPKPVKKPRAKKKKPDSDNDDDNDDDDDDDDDDDNTDSDNDEPKIPPWEEDDGLYGIMSRMVRNVNPTFIWVLKRDSIDYRYLLKDQMVNHYCKAGSFTTKTGLCLNLKNVPWFHTADPDTFFPRCFRLSQEEDKSAFIDDYKLTACMAFVEIVLQQNAKCLTSLPESQENTEDSSQTDAENQTTSVCADPECTSSRPNSMKGNKCVHVENQSDNVDPVNKKKSVNFEVEQSNNSPRLARSVQNKQKQTIVPLKALEIAMQQIEKFLQSKDHSDIDILGDPYALTESQWNDFIQWYYQMAFYNGHIQSVPKSILSQCDFLISRLNRIFPQFGINGTKNIWILKPGAKSRGRGIVCHNKLEDILKVVSNSVVMKESKWVVQKYIERPLLIYDTKFDIRQWILVTDWNPLTIYFYKDSYLRFCSQQFTLDNLDEAIHLSNNAIQKHYKNGPRSPNLPKDNMWSHFQFIDYMKSRKVGHLWDERIYPGMKKAITCALLSTQDLVEYRKSSFELYGADFMLTEDYQPWLIEINCSPTMESSTAVTARLCSSVLEDTVKVAVDRKYDKNCDIGRFELAYKQPLVTVPPYIGISLQVEGQAIKRPGFVKKTNENSDMMFTPRINIRQTLPSERTENKTNGNNSSNTGTNLSIKNNQENSRNHSVHGSKSSGHQDHSKGAVSSSTSKSSIVGKKTNSNINHSNVSGSHSNSGVHHSNSGSNQSQTGGIKFTTSHHSISNSVSKHSNHTENESSSGESHQQRSVVKTAVSSSASTTSQNQKVESGGNLPTGAGTAHPQHSRPTPSLQIPAMSTTGKKIVSTTSVSNNYPAPSLLNKVSERGSSTDGSEGKCIKQTKGVNPLIDGSWARTCNECGSGMNLQLENANVNCKCRQDSIMVFAEPILPENLRNSTVPKSKSPSKSDPSKSPNLSQSHGGLLSPPGVSRSDTVSPSGRNDRILLRYTDAGIQHPLTPHSVISSQLPKIVKRYIARRNTAYNETAYGASSVYLDTSKISNPLSIVSQNYHSSR